MKLVSFIFVGLISLVSFDAWGRIEAKTANASSLAQTWGASMEKCPATTNQITADTGCLTGCDKTGTYGKTVMIAHKINEYGAKLCPTYVRSHRRNVNVRSQVKYNQVNSTSELDCFWACQAGWGGTECKTSTESLTTCDSTTIDISAIKDSVSPCVKGGWFQAGNIECDTDTFDDTVQIFASEMVDCDDVNRFSESGSFYKQEHNVVLGAVRWPESGHGVFVQTMVIDAWCGADRRDNDCKILISPQKNTEELLCKDGYTPNTDKTDCVAINPKTCNIIEMCEGWNAADYTDTTKYRRVSIPDNGWSCYQYRCAAAGYGFKQGTRECIECVDSETQVATFLEETGECVFTHVSKKPVVDDSGNLTEQERKQTSRNSLSSATNNSKELCWMVSDTPSQYKKCILGNDALETLGDGTTSQTSGTTIPGPNINPATYDIYENIQNSNIKLNGKKRFNN